jgi:outer membrane protein TolC
MFLRSTAIAVLLLLPVFLPIPAAAQTPQTLVLSLDDALRIASGESESVWVAQSGVLRALGNEEVARSGLFPQLSASALYTRTLKSQFSNLNIGGSGGSGGGQSLPFGRTNQYSLGLSLSQLLFDGGQTLSQTRAAHSRLRSAEIDVTAAQAQTLLDVTRAYFDAQLADRLIEIAQSSLSQSEEVLRQTDVARRLGERSEYELLRARVARDNQLPNLIRRRSERNQAYLRLKQLLNVPAEDELSLTTPVEQAVPRFATPADASPDVRSAVRQAVENVDASRAQLSAARGQRLPSISLSSRYAPVAYPANGVPDPSDFREDWTVTVNVSVPILTGGRLHGNEEAARGTLSEARARLAQTREAAALDARTAQDDLADAQATLDANTSTVDEATRAWSIAQIRFREGLASQIELSDAQLLLEQAQVNRALALRDVQVARARLALLADLPLSQGSATSAAQSQPQPQPSQTQGISSGSVAAPGAPQTGSPTP